MATPGRRRGVAGSGPPTATLPDPWSAVHGDFSPCGRRLEESTGRREEALSETTVSTTAELLAELAGLEDPKVRAVNERHGDDHGVNLSKLRAIAKRLKIQQPLARELWATDDTAARLLSLLICRPKEFDGGELDSMLRASRAPKVADWLVNYVVKKNAHAEDLRMAWMDDADPVVASAGWALASDRVAKG